MPLLRKALLLCAACAALAAWPPLLRASEPPHGDLVLWFVGQPGQAPAPQPYTQYHEQTAGSFGRPASTVGHAASDVGVTSGSFPATATLGSKPASEVGETAGSFGTPSSNIGQTAGSYGQPASTLGSSATSPAFTQPAMDWISSSSPQLSRVWRDTLTYLHPTSNPPQLRVAFVTAEDLPKRLTATEGTADFPDLLIGSPLTTTRRRLPFLAAVTVSPLGTRLLDPAALADRSEPRPDDALILLHARHPEQARAFLVWLSDQLCGACSPSSVPQQLKLPAALAASAAETLLRGGSLGTEADPDLAQLSPPLASLLSLQPQSRSALNGLGIRLDVLRAEANDHLAVVSLRAIASSPSAFGVLHPLVVLRRSDRGQWRVLQVSCDLPGGLLLDAFGQLSPFTQRVAPERIKPVSAVTQAAPVDGDTRAGAADLWWDNPADAGLLVVEWQMRAGDQWSDTHLSFVPDRGPRPRFRVSAPFTRPDTQYRWRVWSVGYGGMLALSPWRRLTLLP